MKTIKITEEEVPAVEVAQEIQVLLSQIEIVREVLWRLHTHLQGMRERLPIPSVNGDILWDEHQRNNLVGQAEEIIKVMDARRFDLDEMEKNVLRLTKMIQELDV